MTKQTRQSRQQGGTARRVGRELGARELGAVCGGEDKPATTTVFAVLKAIVEKYDQSAKNVLQSLQR